MRGGPLAIGDIVKFFSTPTGVHYEVMGVAEDGFVVTKLKSVKYSILYESYYPSATLIRIETAQLKSVEFQPEFENLFV